MDRLSINLLPPELKLNKKKQHKKNLIIRISVGILMLMILITSGLLSVSIYQKSQLEVESTALEKLKSQLGSYREQEVIAFLLRNRLSGITQAENKQFPQTQAFNLLTGITPLDVSIYAFKVDRSDKVNIQGQTNNTQALGELFINLTDPKVNVGKVSKVNLNSLNKSGADLYRFDLNVQVSNLNK